MAKTFSDRTHQSFSYQNAGNAEGGPDELNRLSLVISTNIQKITQNTNSVQKMVNQIGTAQDSESLRSQLHHVQNYTNQLAKDTHRYLKELTSLAESSSHPYQVCLLSEH
ncbi:syntaxin-7-like, partial [Limulus polyphemus]|uniref:Syntaxin-7-like n=1 Tax=Limulus polyphemus TaxID=6850 RepID=A0ABM1BV88_LIMPO